MFFYVFNIFLVFSWCFYFFLRFSLFLFSFLISVFSLFFLLLLLHYFSFFMSFSGSLLGCLACCLGISCMTRLFFVFPSFPFNFFDFLGIYVRVVENQKPRNQVPEKKNMQKYPWKLLKKKNQQIQNAPPFPLSQNNPILDTRISFVWTPPSSSVTLRVPPLNS